VVPQDTTSLDYQLIHGGRTGALYQEDYAIGLLLRTWPYGGRDPLGILDAQCWARDPKEKGKRYRRKELPIEQKESMKWLRSFQKAAQVQKLCPETMLVVMGDRESDIYELFLEASKEPDGPKLLVRAEKTRNRKVEQEFVDLTAGGGRSLNSRSSRFAQGPDAGEVRFAVTLAFPSIVGRLPPYGLGRLCDGKPKKHRSRLNGCF
jgi:hypothetical protein